MEHQLANQEVARLRYAEALREAARRPLVEKPVAEPKHRIQSVIAWARTHVANRSKQPAVVRAR